MRRRRVLALAAGAVAVWGAVPLGVSGAASTRAATAAATRAAPGAQLWVARFRAGGQDEGGAMAVSPGGGRVFVTGQSYGGPVTGADYKTVAYGAVTGRRLWASRRSGRESSLAVSPDGKMVFVTVGTGNRAGNYYTTVAYAPVRRSRRSAVRKAPSRAGCRIARALTTSQVAVSAATPRRMAWRAAS